MTCPPGFIASSPGESRSRYPVSYTHLDVYKRQQAHDAEADEQAAGAKSNSVPETAAAETDEQEQYSLKEVRLLLKLLQLSKGR